MTLNAEWNVAKTTDIIVRFIAYPGSLGIMVLSKPTKPHTRLTNGCSSINAHVTPITLMLRWAKAARRAWVLAPIATIFAVIVVPTFSPSTRRIPWSICNTPVEQRIMVIAMMAALDCTQSVSTVPMNRKKNEFQKLLSLKREKNALMTALASGSCTRAKPVSLRVPSPKKRNAAPNKKSPMIRRRFMYISMIPTKNAGKTKSEMLNEKPNDMIHAVTVVPMCAPMMTVMACAKVSSPALTNDTVNRVVAVDDCTAAVTNVPVSIPVNRLVVMVPST